MIFEAGLQLAGDASYGPLKDGEREEGPDFNDYLGIEWVYPEQVDKPEKRQRHCLDCSGFIRMVWGYRRHLPGNNFPTTVPLCLKPQKPVARYHAAPLKYVMLPRESCSEYKSLGQRLFAALHRRPRLLRC